MSDRCFLGVKYTPVVARVGTKVGGFLKYVQHRDQHPDRDQVKGLLKYVSHRDRSATKGLLFGPDGPVGDLERRQLAAFIGRSVEKSRPQMTRAADGQLVDRRRAAYRFVLSPENAEGLDLKEMTRAAVRQLEEDAGGLGPWIAAEHRNTAHPHVHLVLAARSEIAPGQFRAVNLTRARLARMKDAVQHEIDRQRGRSLQADREQQLARVRVAHQHLRRIGDRSRARQAAAGRPRPGLLAARFPRLARGHGRFTSSRTARQLRQLARQYRWEAEREVEQRMLDRGQERGR